MKRKRIIQQDDQATKRLKVDKVMEPYYVLIRMGAIEDQFMDQIKHDEASLKNFGDLGDYYDIFMRKHKNMVDQAYTTK